MSRRTSWFLAIVTCSVIAASLAMPWALDARVAGGGGAYGGMSDASGISWSVQRIGAPGAWQRTTGSREIVVAVVDSGIDTSAPLLAGSLWTNVDEIPANGVDDDGNGYIDDVHGWDFRDDDNSSANGSALHWHGTFVAGIIAAQRGPDRIAGIAPGVRIMDVRFLDARNLFYGRDWERFARAIDYAVDNGARVINLSIYANGQPPRCLVQALGRAVRQGVIVIGIAGNGNHAEVCYPGRLDSVFAVSATDADDRLASFSNHGSGIALAAPGSEIVSLGPDGPKCASGTSFAAPHVSGTLALILSANPGSARTRRCPYCSTAAMISVRAGRTRSSAPGWCRPTTPSRGCRPRGQASPLLCHRPWVLDTLCR
jgi:subtilisin family serine protease